MYYTWGRILRASVGHRYSLAAWRRRLTVVVSGGNALWKIEHSRSRVAPRSCRLRGFLCIGFWRNMPYSITALAELARLAFAGADAGTVIHEIASLAGDQLAADRVLVSIYNSTWSSELNSGKGWGPKERNFLASRVWAWYERIRAEASRDAGCVTAYLPGCDELAVFESHGLTSGLLAVVAGPEDCCLILVGRTYSDWEWGESAAEFLRTFTGVMALTVDHGLAVSRSQGRNQIQVARAKHQWELAVDSLPALVCLLDQHGRVIRVNRTLEDWRLGDVRFAEGSELHQLLHPACDAPDCELRRHWVDLRESFDRRQTATTEFYDPELQSHLRLSLHPGHKARFGDAAKVQGFATLIVENLGEQRQSEDVLADYHRELELLSTRLLSAQEEERKRIAAELHDGIGQGLSAAKFGIENLLREASELTEDHRAQLEALVKRIRDTIQELRGVSMALRPAMLDDLGLLVTLNWCCREFLSLFPYIEINRRIELTEAEVPEGLKITIYRIVQEALHNVAKHAGASRVELVLEATPTETRLTIADDGRGFIVDEVLESGQGFGLGSLRERARLSGGRFSIDSELGTGTRIEVGWAR